MDVMLIEDEDDIRLTAQEFLEDEGFKVTAFSNGQDALKLLTSGTKPQPRVILLDLMMPILDGYSFRTKLLQNKQLSGIPCVLMSAHGGLDAKAKELGITRTIRKPIDLDVLLNTVKELSHA